MQLKEDLALKTQVIDALKQVYDPEISINVFDLGLIYTLITRNDGSVLCEHTLTSMMCPFADQICQDIADAIRSVEGVTSCERKLVWDPPFGPDMIPEETKFALGWDM